MKAYVVVQETVDIEEIFNEYKSQVIASFEAYGGRFVTRGGNLTIVEGEWAHPRLVIIEFPTRQAVLDWYHSDRYQAILPLRKKSSRGNFVIVDGMPES
ncbi:hypothetical protein PSE10B_46700 [Pseudomonas amygdali pv. eriobotryae]|uniref:DUF1330 domain-containing protein n=1 Tax=Pseudomonas amygdali pv. eriobotryae TaxID=129137 RepID=A0A0P9QEF2_PSEA0|nr:DUF1330 domain-containing protein [Pseudomonas amygdali]KPX31917.1 Uncharacterized protein ALO70_02042 [Pseudomonas amygdali pv. eriobotryae]KWS78363.1 hypothetical protein AL052_01130 [Pseudomonas amygdali pv. eriobotryae]RMO48407.1 hypothetical protein ALQ39_00589 [Pseudomonas amygdali pv. eriobotryae]GFZ62802.1 hypothetical protein PSE10A_53130 [Pseudomonas amygdali pv. eriobotryae]GFZ68148.1 hypothetical protein PSE10B_46700 [Pseudomonas amygdali pv. eriobotryae]